MPPSDDDNVLTVSGDIADLKTAELRDLYQGMARFGRIDTLVNNAGVFIAKPFLEYSEADFAAMVGINLSRVSFTSRSWLPPRWRSGAAAMSCRSRRAWSTTLSAPYRPFWRR